MPGLFFLMVIWAIKGLEISLDTSFHSLGIYPAKWNGLIGILSAPLIHGSLEHITSNSLPLLVLSTAMFFFYRKIAYETISIIYLVSGIWVWIFAVPGYHIGASGLIYGMAFFLFFSGVFRKKRELIAVALLVVILYGSIIWGLLPYDPKISWQTHLFGAIIGTILSFYHARRDQKKKSNFIPDNNVDSTIDFTDDHGNKLEVNYFYKEKSK